MNSGFFVTDNLLGRFYRIMEHRLNSGDREGARIAFDICYQETFVKYVSAKRNSERKEIMRSNLIALGYVWERIMNTHIVTKEDI